MDDLGNVTEGGTAETLVANVAGVSATAFEGFFPRGSVSGTLKRAVRDSRSWNILTDTRYSFVAFEARSVGFGIV